MRQTKFNWNPAGQGNDRRCTTTHAIITGTNVTERQDKIAYVKSEVRAGSFVAFDNREEHLSIYIYLSIYLSFALVDLGRLFSFLIHTQSVKLLGRGISQSQGPLQNKGTETYMPQVGFETTTPMFERAKTVCYYDRLERNVIIRWWHR
jgi:hypothetical protein